MAKVHKRHRGRKILAILITIALVIAAYVTSVFFFKNSEKTTLDNAPKVLIIPHQGKTIVYRLADEKGNEFDGEWNFSYVKDGNAFMYQGNTLYYLNENNIQEITAGKLRGDIISVLQGGEKDLIAIYSKTDDSSYICINLPVEAEGDKTCSSISMLGEKHISAAWDPKAANTFLVKLSDRIDIRDLNKTIKPTPLEEKDDPEQYQYYDKLLSPPEPDLFKIGHFAFFETLNGWQITSVPFSAKVNWLIPGKFLSLHAKGHVGIIDVTSKSLKIIETE